MSSNCSYPHCMMGGGGCDREQTCIEEEKAGGSIEQMRQLIYNSAIEHYGYKAQKTKAIEECAELIQALAKEKLFCGDNEAVLDEIVDVYVMVQQLILIYGVSSFDERLTYKLNRLSIRIGIEKAQEAKDIRT